MPSWWPSFYPFTEVPYGLQLSRYYRAPPEIWRWALSAKRQNRSADGGHLYVQRIFPFLAQVARDKQCCQRTKSDVRQIWVRLKGGDFIHLFRCSSTLKENPRHVSYKETIERRVCTTGYIRNVGLLDPSRKWATGKEVDYVDK